MHRGQFGVAVLAMAAVMGVGAAQQADTVIYNGKVLTVDAKFSVAEAVAVKDGKIASVGKTDDVLKMAGPNTVKIDLKGKTLIPGLINTHVHVESPGAYGSEMPASKRKTYPLNLRAVKNKEDVLKQIRDTITAFKFKPGEWIYFTTNPRGDQGKMLFDELNRWELDKAAPDNPVAMTLGVPVENVIMVNSKAIDLLWKKYGDFVEKYGRFWVDAAGKPSGILEPPAVRILFEDPDFVPSPAPEDVAPAYKKLLEENYTALGTTTISGGLHTSTVEAYQLLDSRGEMPVRYGYGVMSTFGMPGASNKPFKMGSGTDKIWITSMSSRAIDGAGSRMCINVKRDSGSAAAATGDGAVLMGLSAASEWWPRGQCSMDIEYNGGTRGARLKGNYFVEWFNEVAQDGLRSANSHTAGDASHSMLLTELEKIDRAKPGSVKGWAMDHCDLVDPKDIPRAAKLGMMWSCYPDYAIRSEVTAAFGEKVANTYPVPIKSMLDAGINVSLEGSWVGLETMITRKNDKGIVVGADQKVDRATGLRIATQNGANYVLKGNQLGSIESGKLADLVVLDRDYMTIPEDEISDVKSLMTMLGGKIIYLRTDFATDQNLKPAGALISTFEELRKRRPGGGTGGGGGEGN
jgi:predicted amidohydrolase YtcJ